MSTLDQSLMHASLWKNIGDDGALDESGTGLHVTFNGTVGVSAERDRLVFPSSGKPEWVHESPTGYYDVLNFGSKSFSLHFKFMTTDRSKTQTILWLAGSSTSDRAVNVYIFNNVLSVQLGNGSPVTRNVATLTNGVEYDLTITYDQSTFKCHLDDASPTSSSLVGPLPDMPAGIYGGIGRQWTGSAAMEGTVRQLAVWHKTLSDSEVSELHGGTWSPKSTRPTKIDLMIGLGQSNLNGIYNLSNYEGDDELRLPIGNRSLAFNGTYNGGPSPGSTASRFRKWHANIADWPAAGITKVGPDLGVGAILGDTAAVFKYGYSGSSVAVDWASGGAVWLDAASELLTARDELLKLGFTIENYCVYDVCGESDAQVESQANAYLVNSEDKYARVATLLGISNLKVVVVKLSSGLSGSFPYLETVRTQQEAIVAADPDNREFVPTDDLNREDGLHYDVYAQEILGQRIGHAARSLFASTAAASIDQPALVAAIRADLERTDGMLALVPESVDQAVNNQLDGTDLATTLADKIASDWVAGDATPLAIIEALKADPQFAAIVADTTAAVTHLTDLKGEGWAGEDIRSLQETASSNSSDLADIQGDVDTFDPTEHGLIAQRSATEAATGTLLDVEEASVAKERTAFVRRRSGGLVDESPIRLTVGDENLLCAIDFAYDLSAGGRVASLVDLTILSTTATDSGLVLASETRHRSQLKFLATCVPGEGESITGEYLLKARVKYYGSDGTATAIVRATVAEGA